jgi:hypothetical protein
MFFKRKGEVYKRHFFAALVIFFAMLLFFGRCGDAEADDYGLFDLISSGAYFIDAGGTEFSLTFGREWPESLEGFALLSWQRVIEFDGKRWRVPDRLSLPYIVWDGFVEITVQRWDGSAGKFVADVYRFVPDWENHLVQVCPDLRFFPRGDE